MRLDLAHVTARFLTNLRPFRKRLHLGFEERDQDLTGLDALKIWPRCSIFNPKHCA